MRRQYLVPLFIFMSLNPIIVAQDATLTFDDDVTYQVITGWEATAWAGQGESTAFTNYIDDVLDRAVDEVKKIIERRREVNNDRNG